MSTAKQSTLFYNGRMITLCPSHPTAEAMLVTGQKIAAVGTLAHVSAAAPTGAERVDLAGRVVVPGFNDSHMHLLNWGLGRQGADLTSARSILELITLGRRLLEGGATPQVIIGRGWSDERFRNSDLPTKEDLDQISTAVPVIFTRVCGHVCAVNSKTLKLAGIHSGTKDPAGGSIDRKPHTGEPTGILRETAMELVRPLLPTPTISDLKRILRQAAHSAALLGLTTVQSNDLTGRAGLNRELEAYRQLAADRELPIRINLQATAASLDDIHAYREAKEEYRDLGPYLSLGPVKLYADGSLGAKTAALSHPYADAPHTSGITLYEQGELDELVLAAARGNLQVAVHAIGDGALQMVLDSYAQAKQTIPGWKERPRVVHCQIAHLEQLQRMAKLGIIADIQPIFVPTDRHFVKNRIGKKAARNSYAWKTMTQLGVRTAGGSDCPVEDCNPLLGLWAAITRDGWHTEQCLTPQEALNLFTLGSAYATADELLKGSLSPGKLGDFVVLPEDPLTVDPQQLLNMKVEAAYVGGERVTP